MRTSLPPQIVFDQKDLLEVFDRFLFGIDYLHKNVQKEDLNQILKTTAGCFHHLLQMGLGYNGFE